MYSDNKITFWGDIDMSVRLLEDTEKKFSALWESGRYRMLPEEIDRMSDAISRLRSLQSKMSKTLSSFTPIAIPKDQLRKESIPFLGNGLIPDALSSHE